MNGLYRTEFFRKNSINWTIYKKNDYSSDTINSLHFIMNGMKYSMVQEHLINYRIHDHNGSHNIEQRIKTSLAVYDYIIQHFDEAVYLPHIEWDRQPNRKQMKNYTIALLFYEKIQNYYKLHNIPLYINYNITQKKIHECVSGFVKEGMQYIQKGLTQGNTLRDKLLDLDKNYKNL